jgi:hypothetical protein
VEWAYGITTVPSRRRTTLPKTVSSLAEAGFDKPRYFVDSWDGHTYPGEATYRSPQIRTFGNWILALAELYIRQPYADRYAVFQDDVVACKKLREHLERSTTQADAYWNCITYPGNMEIAKRTGWNAGNRQGLGAQGLVFSNDAVLKLLVDSRIGARVRDRARGWKSVDGAVVFAMAKVGYSELVHYPSLMGHTGVTSSMGNGSQPFIPFDPTYDPTLGAVYQLPPKREQKVKPVSFRIKNGPFRPTPYRQRPVR